ncbi:MAG TPA: GGDEF domain-containing protein [Nitrospira sp.]|jgi:diguanylate cyclase (GGDEF)-like protein|nr:GGDEF domain-containing protein [Nitrospira sp.]
MKKTAVPMSVRADAIHQGVYAELVRSVYSTLVPTTIMSVGYVLSFAVIGFEHSDWVAATFAILGILSGAFRIGTLLRDRSIAPLLTAERMQSLERRFAVSYYQFAVLLGVSAAYVFTLDAARFHMLMICLIVGYGAGVAAGVGLRPWIAIPSMMIAIVPAILVAALHKDLAYGLTSAMTTALLAGGSQSLLRRYRTTNAEIARRLTFEALARQDVLTSLPNRLALREWFDGCQTLGNRQGLMAVHLIDLDKFKPVNDVFGHPVGDGLLQAIAARLTNALRPRDIAARLGGDEFVVIQRELETTKEAAALAQRLREAISAPFTIKGHEISVSACIGCALSQHALADLDELIGLADQALYAAKNAGTGIEYDHSLSMPLLAA